MEETPKQKRKPHTDRITLTPDNVARVDTWIKEVTSLERGVTLGRREMVNYIIRQHSEKLANDDISTLRRLYFDEVRFLRGALRELRAAKLRGEAIALEDVLRVQRTHNKGKSPRTKKLPSPTASKNNDKTHYDPPPFIDDKTAT